jgi:hypothetical protein
MWYETINELFKQHNRWGKTFDAEALKNAVASADSDNGASLAPGVTFRETTNGGNYSAAARSLMVLETFEVELSQRSGPQTHLVAQRLTYADLALWCELDKLDEAWAGWPTLDGAKWHRGFPKLTAFKVCSCPQQLWVVSVVGRFNRVDQCRLWMASASLYTCLLADPPPVVRWAAVEQRQIEHDAGLAGYLLSDRRMPRVERRDGDYHYIQSRRLVSSGVAPRGTTCCSAMTASCLACQHGVSIEDLCAHATVAGCPTPAHTGEL